MRSLGALRRPRGAGLAAALLAAAVAGALLVPPLRGPLLVCVPWLAVVCVLVGLRRHRPAGAGLWLLLVLLLVSWGCAQPLGRAGHEDAASVVLAVGQVAAPAVLVGVARRSARSGRRVDLLELFLVAAVLGLTAAQCLALVSSGADDTSRAVIASTDVLILAFVLRFALVRRSRLPAWWCAVGAGVGLVVFDISTLQEGLAAADDGPRTAALLLGTGLFGVAALHRSSRLAFDRVELSVRVRRSAGVVALLPLVAVPLGLRAVDLLFDDAGLPAWVHLAVGTSTAAAGVLRSGTALGRAEHLAEHDPLTDLPNRRGLARVFEDPPDPRGWALLLVDLDEFKDVNDGHGHDVGDALLLAVRDRLVAAGGREAVVARFGGDEFAVLVRPGHEEVVAERLVACLRAPVDVRDLHLRTSASIGVAPPEAGASLSEQLTRADVALYAAKGAGRDTVRSFHPDQRAEVLRRFTLTSQVRQLLGGRSGSVGRLEMHYQPLVELATGEVVGAEALVRWCHPEHGLMAPDAFLGHVAASGLDAELDAVVLQDVLEQMGRWRDQQRRALPVSVNLTRSSLLDPGLPARVRDGLARAGVPGDQLHVEITEHEPLPEDDRLLEALQDLRALGVGIHLDDYGSGYTSLDYLRRFPVQVLKVDRSVVAGVEGDGGQLVAGLGAMSRTLHLDLLAEGVETEAQRHYLVANGVRLGQGWLFSRPLTARDYADGVLGTPPERRPAVTVPAPRLPLATTSEAPR